MKNQCFFALSINRHSALRNVLFALCLALLPGIRAWSQTPVCNDMVSFSVDGTCSATIVPDQILEGGPYNYPDYTVELDKDGGCDGPWLPPVLGAADINQTYCVRVTYTVNSSSCTGMIHVEDKLPPVINCPPDQTIASTASTWVPHGASEFTAGWAINPAFVFSGTTPYLAYRDNANGDKMTVMKFDGVNWVNVGTPGFTANRIETVSLAFSGTTPYVAYQDWANGFKISVKKFDGVNWVNVGAPGFSSGTIIFTSLAISGGIPYVAFSDNAYGYKLRVMKFDGINWVNVGTPGFSTGICYNESLAFSGSTLYVAFSDGGIGFKERVMQFDGTNWVDVGTSGFSTGQTFGSTSLAFSGTTPYVAFRDDAYGYKARVMKFDGAAWVNVGIPGFSAGAADEPSLAFSGTTPYVAYGDHSAGPKISVMKFDGAAWVYVGTPGFSPDYAQGAPLAFSNGIPYVLNWGTNTNSKATVLKLASITCDGLLGDWTNAGSATDNCANPVSVAQIPAANTLLSFGNMQTTVRLTASDNSGNTSSCTFNVTLGLAETCDGYDNDCNGVVDDGCPIVISGRILWSGDNAKGVNTTTVKLSGSVAPPVFVTGTNGAYAFNTGLFSGSFTIKPTKNINKLNGLTSADVTAVQQHVGNSVPITDPYKLVAADVNQSNSVNGGDVTIINQLLLGNPGANAAFSTSWRFVPFSYPLSLPPWGFPEQINLANIVSTQPYQDFIGIKIGDVVATFANPANFGADQSLVWQVEDRALEPGTEIAADFTADPVDDLASFQFALHFDPAQLQLTAIEPLSGLPVTTDHFGTYNIGEGEIRMVWSRPQGLALDTATPVFRLRFAVLQGGAKLSEVLYLDNDVLPGYSYDTALSESGVELKYTETTGTGDPAGEGLQLYQNRPNPFNGNTVIGFYLPEGCEAQLRVFDVSGRMLAEKKASYTAGKHEETFDLGGVTGVLYCELVTPFGALTRKMISYGSK